MTKMAFRILLVAGLGIGISVAASASPVTGAVNLSATSRDGIVEQADFTYTHHDNHHHRSWDKAHHRWHYYG